MIFLFFFRFGGGGSTIVYSANNRELHRSSIETFVTYKFANVNCLCVNVFTFFRVLSYQLTVGPLCFWYMYVYSIIHVYWARSSTEQLYFFSDSLSMDKVLFLLFLPNSNINSDGYTRTSNQSVVYNSLSRVE